VPGELRGPGLAHKPLLAFRVLGLVRRRLAVAGPGRAAPFRLQSPDELLQAPHVRLDQLLAEAGGLELLAHFAAAIGVLGLEPVVKDDVRQDAATPARKERTGLARLDPRHAAAQPRLPPARSGGLA